MSFVQQVLDETERWATKKDPKKRALMRTRMVKFAEFVEKCLCVHDKGQVGDRTVIKYWKASRTGNVPRQRAHAFRTQEDYWNALVELWPLIGKVGAPPKPHPFDTKVPNDESTLANANANNKASGNHRELVMRVAQQMQREGRIVWTALAMQEPLDTAPPRVNPDVFSIRNTTVQAELQPVVHEIKMSRADLLGDLKRPEMRSAYVAMASQVYYVLGLDAKGQPIAQADEVPAEYGVLVATNTELEIVRTAPKHPFTELRFDVWMALVKAAPIPPESDQVQIHLKPARSPKC